MKTKIVPIQTSSDLQRCFEVMRQLRPHLNYEDYILIYQEAHQSDGYEIVALEEQREVVALMGYRVLSDFVRGRHLYIDDLVTREDRRSRGLGAILLNYAENLAPKLNCKTLRLCTGLENTGGIKFYEKNGWTRRSLAYIKKTSSIVS